MPVGIGPLLPLTDSQEDGKFAAAKTINQEIKQNFKNLLLTNPGERIWDTNFGIGIKRYLFEQQAQQTYGDIDSRIRSQAKRYMSSIRINKIDFISALNTQDVDENVLGIKIDFTILVSNSRNIFNIPVLNPNAILETAASSFANAPAFGSIST